MIPILAGISAIICTIFLLFSLQLGVLAIISLKSLIDAAWFFSLGPLRNIGSIFVVIAELIIFYYLLVEKKRSRWKPSLKLLWILYSFNIVFVSIHNGYSNPVAGMQFFFRLMNGPIGWILIPFIIRNDKDFKLLALASIIGAITPSIFSFLHISIGLNIHDRFSAGLNRIIGVYHDAVTYRIYVLPGLLFLWVYASFYLKRKTMLKMFLIYSLTFIFLFVLYKTYSKAVFVTLACWCILFALHRKKLILAGFSIFVLFVVMGVTAMNSNILVDEYSTLFGKEAAVLSGDSDRPETALGGRIGMWDDLFKKYETSSFFDKVFGMGRNVAAHNEFFRHLIVHGYVGTLIYAVLFCTISFRLFTGYFKDRNDMAFLALLIWIQYIIEVLGQTPSFYTNYQWFVFGTVSLYFCGFRLTKQKE